MALQEGGMEANGFAVEARGQLNSVGLGLLGDIHIGALLCALYDMRHQRRVNHTKKGSAFKNCADPEVWAVSLRLPAAA
jgi:hypothetical protein